MLTGNREFNEIYEKYKNWHTFIQATITMRQKT